MFLRRWELTQGQTGVLHPAPIHLSWQSRLRRFLPVQTEKRCNFKLKDLMRENRKAIFPQKNYELCPGKRFAGPAWDGDKESWPAPSLGPLDSLQWGKTRSSNMNVAPRLEHLRKNFWELFCPPRPLHPPLGPTSQIQVPNKTFSGLYWVGMGRSPWRFDQLPVLILPGGPLKLPLMYLPWSWMYLQNIIWPISSYLVGHSNLSSNSNLSLKLPLNNQ